jgi:hypothetical protein
VPQLIAKTKDPFAVTEVCDWADALDAENLHVSEPDADDWCTVTLYGLPESDSRFRDFAALLQRQNDDGVCPWVSVDPGTRDLRKIRLVHLGDLWRANFQSQPGIAFFHEIASRAAEHLCEDFGIAIQRLRPAEGPSESDLMILVLPQDSQECPDCRGSGKYEGFTIIEACRRCVGSGRITT